MPVEGEYIAFKIACGCRIEDRAAGGDVSRRHRRQNRRWTDVIVGRAGVKEWRVRQVPQEEVLRESVKEDAKTSAYHRSSLARDIPGDTGARRKIVVVRFVQPAQSARPDLGQGKIRSRQIKACNVAE